MQSTTATSSTTVSTAVRVTLPAPPPAQDALAHQALLSHFPSELQAEIARVFPTLQDLQAFHDDLRDSDIPLDGFKPVARMLKVARDARDLAQASLAQDRELHFHHGSGMDNVNCRDHDGATSLHNAILCYSAGKVRKLLAGGARPDLEVGPAQRKSAFVATASLARKLTMIADDSAVNETIIDALKGPLDSAASKSCTRVLIEHAGENALTLAISYEAPFEIIAMLIEHCVQHCPELLRQVDGKGNPPLLLAAAAQRRDAINVVRMLLQCGAAIDVDQTNGLQRTALMEAVRNGDAAMVTLLLQAGASCYAVDNHGYNATAHAVLCGSPTLHKLLIDFIDKDTTGSTVETAHDFCRRDFTHGIIRGQATVISQMLAIQKQHLPGAEATVPVWKKQLFAEFIGPGLAIAVRVPGNGAVIRCLTEQVAVDEPDAIGLHLWRAAIDRDAFEALLDAACKPDMTVMDPGRRQAILALAARHGSVRYACLALDAGADIEALDPATGCSPLMTAVQCNERPLIVELLRRGAGILGNAVPVPGNMLAAPLAHCALATARDLVPAAMAGEMADFIVYHCPDLYRQPHHAGLLLDFALDMKLPALATRLIKDGKLEPRWFQHRPTSLLIDIVETGSAEFAAAILQPGAPLLQLLNADNGNADRALALASAAGDKEIFHLILAACGIDSSTPRALLQSRLLLAVAPGCGKSCELILTQGRLQLPPTAPADENPLILAVQRRHHHLIPLLLDHGAHACARHGQKASALSRAIAADDRQAVALLLEWDRHPEELADAFPQLLRKCIASDSRHAFELLITKSVQWEPGADVLSTMLQHAVTLGSLPACKLLFKRGASSSWTTAECLHLFELALRSPHPSLDIVRLIFSNEKSAAAIYGNTSVGPRDATWFSGVDPAKIVEGLARIQADEAQVIEWIALMFCAFQPTFSSTYNDLTIMSIAREVAPLSGGNGERPIEAMQSRALQRAKELAGSMPDPATVLQQLSYIARVLDLEM